MQTITFRFRTLCAVALTSALAACDGRAPTAPVSFEPSIPSPAAQAGSKRLSIGLCSPSRGGFTTQSTNPYFPMTVGRQWVFEGEENGEPLALQLTVLDRTRVIRGIVTRVIEERDYANGELEEISWNYYVQAGDGTVCYYGEDVDIFTEAGITHDGRWCGDTQGFEPGIIMPADPRPGMTFQMELAPGVAEDEGQIVGTGPVEVPFDDFSKTVRVREFNPLDGSTGYKIFAFGTGLIVDGLLQLVDVRQTSGAPARPRLSEQICGE